MPLEYKGEDTAFSLSIAEYNHAREVLNQRLQRGAEDASRRLIIASERHLASIIGRLQVGTEHQRSWVLQSRNQINEEIRQCNVIRRQLAMIDSPLHPIPEAPSGPDLHPHYGEEEHINPQSNAVWRVLENTLFFGGLAANLYGVSHVLTGGYHTIRGGNALFKATEEVGKKAAEATISGGMAEFGTGCLVAQVGDALMQVSAPRMRAGNVNE